MLSHRRSAQHVAGGGSARHSSISRLPIAVQTWLRLDPDLAHSRPGRQRSPAPMISREPAISRAVGADGPRSGPATRLRVKSGNDLVAKPRDCQLHGCDIVAVTIGWKRVLPFEFNQTRPDLPRVAGRAARSAMVAPARRGRAFRIVAIGHLLAARTSFNRSV